MKNFQKNLRNKFTAMSLCVAMLMSMATQAVVPFEAVADSLTLVQVPPDTDVLGSPENLEPKPIYQVRLTVVSDAEETWRSALVPVRGNGTYQAEITLPTGREITLLRSFTTSSPTAAAPANWEKSVLTLGTIFLDTLEDGLFAVDASNSNAPQAEFLATLVSAGPQGLGVFPTWHLSATFTISGVFCEICDTDTDCTCCLQCGWSESTCTCCVFCDALEGECDCCSQCGKPADSCECCEKCGYFVCMCCIICRGTGAWWCVICCNHCGVIMGFCECIDCTGVRATCPVENCATCPPAGVASGGYRSVQLAALDGANDAIYRGSVLTLDDHNRTYTLKLEFPAANAPTEILQLGILSEGGIFDYEPAYGIYPFTDIRRAPVSWGNSRLTVRSVSINGVSNNPRSSSNIPLVAPDTDWYPIVGYINFNLWNAWYKDHNRLTGIVPFERNQGGELITGFSLADNAPITSIEVEFAVSRMPGGAPPACSGNPLTCRAGADCKECEVEFIPPSENATLNVVIDGINNIISYQNTAPVYGSFAYAFSITHGENEVLWDIIPGTFPQGSIPLFLNVPETGTVLLAGSMSRAFPANGIFALQDFFGCPLEIKIEGVSINFVQTMGDCKCEQLAGLCPECRETDCVCCDACGGKPVGECCKVCKAVCGNCADCDPRDSVPTMRVLIDEVNNVIYYYNNSVIHADFGFKFVVTGTSAEFVRPAPPNGIRFPQGTLAFTEINPATGEAVITGIMGSVWAADRLLFTQEFEPGSEIEVSGAEIKGVERITCAQCVQVNCICCKDCGNLECSCEGCPQCNRAISLCRCCVACKNYDCICRGLRAVIDRNTQTISYFLNTELRNTPFNFQFTVNGQTGTIKLEQQARLEIESEISGNDIVLRGAVTNRLTAGTLVATQMFVGCARRIHIPVLIGSDIIKLEVICDCAECPRGDIRTLSVIVDAIENLIFYYTESAISGDFKYDFYAEGTLGDLREPDGVNGPRWPRGSPSRFQRDAKTGATAIAGEMFDEFPAGSLIAVQSFTGDVDDLKIPESSVLRRVSIIGCSTCKKMRCICFSFMSGDINGDGVVDIADALQILRYVVGLSSEILKAPFNGKNSGNGTGSMQAYNASRTIITYKNTPELADAIQILRHSVGLSSVFDECPPNCTRALCRREGKPPLCQQQICITCKLKDCKCMGILRVEIDARENLIRYFHDVPIRAGENMNFLFKVHGNGITIKPPSNRATREVMFDDGPDILEYALFEASFPHFNAGATDVVFAGIMRNPLPAGTFIAVQSFTGRPENIVFEHHENYSFDYPIGKITIVY